MNQDTHYKLLDMLEYDELDILKRMGYTWNDPYDIIYKFEDALSEYTQAPYVVTTDCCTHAMELCFRWLAHNNQMPAQVKIPLHTYLSVPMMLAKLGIKFTFNQNDWLGEYQLNGSPIWDSARLLAQGMYKLPHYFQCLSFGIGKPLTIGRGGAILLDSREAYEWLSRARSDGRDLKIKPWSNQTFDFIGYHYNMTVEQAAKGLIMLDTYENNFDFMEDPKLLYPNLSECVGKINDHTDTQRMG